MIADYKLPDFVIPDLSNFKVMHLILPSAQLEIETPLLRLLRHHFLATTMAQLKPYVSYDVPRNPATAAK